jgi:hypothetical protein
MLQKFCITLLILITLGLSNPSSAATLPLNTGYDYSNWNTYPATTPDNYWIRIASYPTMAVGPSWAVLNTSAGAPWIAPMPGPTGIPSMWINAFGNTAAGPNASVLDPKYAIYRKCFCLPAAFTQPKIQGSVRNDDSIQIWFNSQLNTVLSPSPLNMNTVVIGAPYTINYTDQTKFRIGRNCLYVLVEDTGGHTGFDLAANLTVNTAIPPMIATGPNMSFGNCTCGQGVPVAAMKKMETEDDEVIAQIVKFAEERRLKRTKNEK